jgi:hypothetical protein
MSDRDTEGKVSGTRFAGDLRRQFEALGERAPDPRKHQRAVVVAIAAAVAVATLLGGVALAGGFHSDSPPQPLWPAATPGGSPQPGAPAASVYPTNANGQTYGPDLPMVDQPDLVLVGATNGKTGYCLRTDLWGPMPKTLEEAAAYMKAAQTGKDRVIPVYESDGTTQIGVFTIGHGGEAHVGTWTPN